MAWKYLPPSIFEFPKAYIFISESFILVANFAEKNPIEAKLFVNKSKHSHLIFLLGRNNKDPLF